MVEQRVAVRDAMEAPSVEAMRAQLRVVEESLAAQTPSVPKTVAAGLLGVSVPALDRWIARGMVRTVRNPGSTRTEVDPEDLVALVREVRKLREMGDDRALLSKALQRLRENDPDYQRRIVEAIGPALATGARGDSDWVTIPEGFGPDD